MTRNVAVTGAVAVLVSLSGLTLAQNAGAAVYWTNQPATSCQGSIGRANLDGSLVSQTFITGADMPNGVAVNATHIYWANTGPCLNSIARASLDGTSVDQAFIAGTDGPSGPSGIALDDSYLYWANLFDYDSIGTADLAGSNVDESFIPTAGQPCAVAVDADHVYWADSNTIGRANYDGTGIDPGFIQGADSPCGVVVDSTHIYWTNTGGTTIGRANLDGSQSDQSFITGASAPCGIAIDAQYIYWGNSATGAIGRANLDGSQADQSFITGATRPCGVAVDSTVWTRPSIVARPAIAGTPAAGQKMTCSQGSWAGSPVTSYAFQWLLDGTAISAATGSTYTVLTADGGHTLTCRVTASNIAGQATATSSGVRVRVPAPSLSVTVQPRVRGTTVVLTLTCTAPVGRRCTGSETLTTTEHRSGKKVLGISSYGRPTVAKIVTLGRTISSIAAGRSKAIRLELNARGRALLKRFHELPGRLTVRLTKGVPRPRVVLSKAVRFNQVKRKA
jgi:hypothetical protein